jgi:hypothetical protein
MQLLCKCESHVRIDAFECAYMTCFMHGMLTTTRYVRFWSNHGLTLINNTMIWPPTIGIKWTNNDGIISFLSHLVWFRTCNMEINIPLKEKNGSYIKEWFYWKRTYYNEISPGHSRLADKIIEIRKCMGFFLSACILSCPSSKQNKRE